MKNFYYKLFKNTLTMVLTVAIASLLVAVGVYAATTIGDDVSVGDALGVTGNTTLTGTLGVTGISTFTKATTTSATSTAYVYVGPDFSEDAGMNFAGGDLFVSDDANVKGDLYMGKGIDMIGSSTTTGLFLGGTYSTSAITINGTGIDGRALRIGSKVLDGTSTDGSLQIASGSAVDTEPANNYLFGLFAKVSADEGTSTDELRGAWIRTRVNADMHVGSNANWGYGVTGLEAQLKFYGGDNGTDAYSWQNSALWAQLETQGATTNFKSGSVASAVLANVGLTATTVIDDGAVVAGVSINSNTADTDVTVTGGFYGLYVYQDGATNKDFARGIQIDGNSSVIGINIGTTTAAAINIDTIDSAATGVGIAIGAEEAAPLKAATNFAISSNTTSSSTASVIAAISSTHHVNATNAQGRAFLGTLEVDNVKLGASSNAIKGYIDFNTSGQTSGLASAINAEMNMPGAAMTGGGTYGVQEIELVCPASWSGTNVVSFIYMQASGTTVANFDDNGYLLNIQGLTAGEGDLFDATTAADIDATHTLKIRIGSTTYYIPLNTDPDLNN